MRDDDDLIGFDGWWCEVSLCEREGEERVLWFTGGACDASSDVDEMRMIELIEHSVERGGRNAEIAGGVTESRVGVLVEVSQIRESPAMCEGADDFEELGETSRGRSCHKEGLERGDGLLAAFGCRRCAVIDAAFGVCGRDEFRFTQLLEIEACRATAKT